MKESQVSPRTLFLIDGIGAAVSAIFLGIILVKFQPHFGMPITMLYPLSIAAVIFAIYSSVCYFRLPSNWTFFLQAIAVINIGYATVTAALVVLHFQQLTYIGIGYFIAELLIVVTLASAELKRANSGSTV